MPRCDPEEIEVFVGFEPNEENACDENAQRSYYLRASPICRARLKAGASANEDLLAIIAAADARLIYVRTQNAAAEDGNPLTGGKLHVPDPANGCALVEVDLRTAGEEQTALALEARAAGATVGEAVGGGAITAIAQGVRSQQPFIEQIATPIDDEEAEQRRSFQEQCFLLYNWKAIANFNRDTFYRRFVKLHDGGYSPSAILSLMNSTTRSIREIENLPEAYSTLVPQIRLFKSYVPSTGEPVDIEIPFDNSLPNQHFIDMISDRNSRGRNVSLKSFEFSNSGNMPGAALRRLEATLALRLTTLQDLEFPRAHPHQDSPRLDAEQRARFADVDPVRILDLLRVEPSVLDGEAGTPNPNYYRIKAVVGWSQPRTGTLRTFVDKTTHVFYLDHIDHELDLKADGSINITIKYIATVEGALRSTEPGDSDVFFGTLTPANRAFIVRERQRIATTRADRDDRINEARCSARRRERERTGRRDPADDADPAEDAADDIRSADEGVIEEENRRTEMHRMILYQDFMETLVQNAGLKYIDVAPEQLGTLNFGQLSEREAAAQRVSQGLDPTIGTRIKTMRLSIEHYDRAGSPRVRAAVSRGDGGADANDQAARQALAAAEGVNATRARTDSQRRANEGGWVEAGENLIEGLIIGSPRESLIQSLVESSDTERISDGKFRVFFLYLGDIINTALAFMDIPSTRRELKDLRFLIGPTEFADPAHPSRHRMYVNLADVPISYNEFQKWFAREIIAQDVLTISFHSFMSKLTEKLLRRAFGPRCFDINTEGDIANSGVVRLTHFSRQTDVDPFSRAVPPSPYGGRNFDFNQENFSGSSDAEIDADAANTSHYAFLYGQMRDPTTLMFDPSTAQYDTRRTRDAHIGIHHLYHGSPVGIVKNISFKKESDARLRDANIAAAYQRRPQPGMPGSASPCAFPRERYKASVTMFGNGMFKPGDYVYINPSIWNPTATAHTLCGTLLFKGYYLVLSTSSFIEAGKYETEITCRFEADGETARNFSDRPTSTADVECEEAPTPTAGTPDAPTAETTPINQRRTSA